MLRNATYWQVKMVTVTTPAESFSVSHLPPVALTFSLPPDYPSETPPEYKLECRWMTEEQESLEEDMKRINLPFVFSNVPM